jgi:two-component system chemotaxis response regulator CheB
MLKSVQNPIRVAIVDDSPLMLRLLRSALEGQDDIQVVGMAKDAYEAREIIRAEDPDVVTLDVALPGMSGIEFLQKIMELRPMPVIMVSSLTAEGAETSLTALQIGAVDVVQKPCGADALAGFPALMQQKVRLAASARPAMARKAAEPARVAGAAGSEARPARASRSLIAIGASTGGVGAISTLLSALPPSLPPVVIVQHMPKGYPERLASRLHQQLSIDVAEARDGEALRAGMIRIAPGHCHLTVAQRSGRIETVLSDLPPVSGHCPSVDVLFESVARALGRRAMGIILTGMGRDGAIGLAAMRRSGAVCLGQGPDSCVVYGMPKVAREMGAIDEEVELYALPDRICHFLNA